MVTSIKVEYITVSPHSDTIELIGGVHPDGTRWKLSTERAIRAIEEGQWNFHVLKDGIARRVTVASRRGTKFLLPAGDTDGENSLLQLPAMPPAT